MRTLLTVSIEKELKEELQKYSKESLIPYSALVSRAIKNDLDKYKNSEKEN